MVDNMDKTITTSKAVITIRPATPTDAELVREIRLESLKNHPDVFAADYESSIAESVQFWTNRITNNTLKNEGLICIALAEDRLAGITGIYRNDRPKIRHNGTIWGVYVKSDWRGLHVAEALINECLAWAKAHGLVTVKLGVITSNTSAIRCYTRCGFVVYGVDPKVILSNGVYHDELLMAKSV
jgi:ribosomal protein S18 acetylase RimI-like enzyme